jgi:SAM-dependent methyltransferase
MTQGSQLEKIYRERFDDGARRRKARVWGVLCRHFFQRYVRPDDTVLDLGAGHCEFVNSIECRERIAVDGNPDLARFAAPGVRAVVATSSHLEGFEDASVDVVFCSNFLEHLADKTEVLSLLADCHRVLRPGGRLLVLQPNIRVVKGRYWDFFDHHVPLTERSLKEAFVLVGLEVLEARARFLPYTTVSALPQHPVLVRLYLLCPPVHRLLGGQAWVVGVKR